MEQPQFCTVSVLLSCDLCHVTYDIPAVCRVQLTSAVFSGLVGIFYVKSLRTRISIAKPDAMHFLLHPTFNVVQTMAVI